MNKIISNIINSYYHVAYTIRHVKCFVQTEKKLTKKIRFKSYFHDLDKLLMYIFIPFLGTNKIQIIHRRLSNHHSEHSGNDYLSMIVDWECARFTKPDKPLNARETYEKYYCELKEYIEPILKELKL